jgi:outer membrane protein TolC
MATRKVVFDYPGQNQLQGLEDNPMNQVYFFRTLRIAGLAMLCAATSAGGAGVRRLTLAEAVRLAVAQNRQLKIARLKIEENEQKKAGEHSAYFPAITTRANVWHITELQNIEIPAGALGTLGGELNPTQTATIPQGQTTLYSSGTMIAQPLTQLLRIHQANRIAAAEVASSRDDLKKAENETALQVHTLYYGLLVAQLQKKAAEQQTTYAAENLRESEEDVRNGSALKVAAIGGRAGLLEGQQAVLTADIQLSDLKTELNDLLGLPLDTELELDPEVPKNFETLPKAEYLKMAWAQNPEILAAEEMVQKARAGVAAAKTAYIPDITAFARYSYQDGVPFLVRNFGTFGVNLDYDLFDFGKRRAAVRERAAQLAQAEQNLERLKEDVAVEVERSYNKVERTKSLVNVASQVAELRQESERLATNQLAQGEVLVSERRQASAAVYKAQADLLQASLGYLLARAELERTLGKTPGL